MPEAYIGQIILFAANFAPSGWALCNGQVMAIQQNEALYSVIGTIYGGDGRSTFAFPNLQGRVPVHYGTGQGLSPVALGQTGGSANVTLLPANLPAHTHPVAPPCSTAAGTVATPANSLPASSVTTVTITGSSAHGSATTNTYAQAAGANQSMASFPSGPAGAGLPIDVHQPYLGLSFIICLVGVYPTRN